MSQERTLGSAERGAMLANLAQTFIDRATELNWISKSGTLKPSLRHQAYEFWVGAHATCLALGLGGISPHLVAAGRAYVMSLRCPLEEARKIIRDVDAGVAL